MMWYASWSCVVLCFSIFFSFHHSLSWFHLSKHLCSPSGSFRGLGFSAKAIPRLLGLAFVPGFTPCFKTSVSSLMKMFHFYSDTSTYLRVWFTPSSISSWSENPLIHIINLIPFFPSCFCPTGFFASHVDVMSVFDIGAKCGLTNFNTILDYIWQQ